MSLATLKRKTAAKYNNLSVSKPQFSINGTLRSHGWVGQSVVSRSLPRTTMRSDILRGSDSYLETQETKPSIVSGIQNYNNSSVVKSSTLSSRGMMQTKYRWVKRSYPHVSVKPTNANNLLSHTERVELIKQKNDTCIESINAEYHVNGIYVKPQPQRSCNLETIDCKKLIGFANNNYNARLTKIDRINSTITKPADSLSAKSQSDYISNLKKKCETNNSVNLPSTLNRTPIV